MEKRLEIADCDLCGSKNYCHLFTAIDNQFHIEGKFKVVKCNNCDLCYISPRPTVDEIGKYYLRGRYFSHKSADKVTKSIRQHIKKWVLEDLYNHGKLNRNKKFITRVIKKVIACIFQSKIAVIVPPKENGRLLDIGCGNGAFLKLMKEYGWETYGVEISEDATKCAREQGLEVFRGELRDANYPLQYFDAIVINQLLEHVHSPKNILLECNRIIKKDGILIIGVPNFDCFDRKLFKESWSSLQVPTHLYHFTSHSLKMHLEFSGFKLKRIKYDSILKQYIPNYMLVNLKYFLENQKKVHKNKNIISALLLIEILMKVFLYKPFVFLFSKDKSRFSINITVYASRKMNDENSCNGADLSHKNGKRV